MINSKNLFSPNNHKETSHNLDWKLFMLRVYQKSKENDILIHAMGMVYITLLSIVPFLLFLFYIMTLFDFFGRMNTIIEEIQIFILNNLAAGTGQSLLNYLESYVYNVDLEQLGIISFTSLIVIIIFMLARVEITFNKIWSVEEHRDILKRFVSFWTVITLGTFIFTLLLTLAIFLSDKYLAAWLQGMHINTGGVFNLFLFSLNFLIFTAAYYFIPNTNVEAKAAIFSGIISGLLFILSKNLYSIYTDHVITYKKLYGSLSVIPIFFVWIYLIWVIILLGAVISYVFQFRKSLKYLDFNYETNRNIENMLPAAILIILHKALQKNEKKGLTFEDILKRIKLSPNIIKKELKNMKEKSLIAETKNDLYIPLADSADINLWEIYKPFNAEDKLNITKFFTDKEINKYYNYTKENLKNSLKPITVKNIIEKDV